MKFYTPEEVANILRISKHTVYELIKRKELKSKKIGRVYRISEEALREFTEEEKEKKRGRKATLEYPLLWGN